MKSCAINITYNCPRLNKKEQLLLDITQIKNGIEPQYDVVIHHLGRNNIWGEFIVTRKGESWTIDNNTDMELDNISLITGCDLVGLNKLGESITDNE